MDFINYYKVMGVADHATHAAIKQAYRKLARRFHPDVSKEQYADAQFKAVGEAYAVLKDTKKRTEYDQTIALSSAGDKRKSARTSADNRDSKVSHPYKNASKAHFNAGKPGCRRQRPTVDRDPGTSSCHRGLNLHQIVFLSLEEAVQGIQRTLKLNIPTVNVLGLPIVKNKTFTVKIPPGVVTGQRIRLAGQGGTGVGGGAKGDFFMVIELAQHSLFTVAERDVFFNLAGCQLGGSFRCQSGGANIGRAGKPDYSSRLGQR